VGSRYVEPFYDIETVFPHAPIRRALPNAPSGYAPEGGNCPSNRPSVRSAGKLSPNETSWLKTRRSNTVGAMRDLLDRLNISNFDAASYINDARNDLHLPNIAIAALPDDIALCRGSCTARACRRLRDAKDPLVGIRMVPGRSRSESVVSPDISGHCLCCSNTDTLTLLGFWCLNSSWQSPMGAQQDTFNTKPSEGMGSPCSS
jgi:hypothetical protein